MDGRVDDVEGPAKDGVKRNKPERMLESTMPKMLHRTGQGGTAPGPGRDSNHPDYGSETGTGTAQPWSIRARKQSRYLCLRAKKLD